MKKFHILIIALVSMIISSCEIHTSDNGDMDNFWMLTTVDTLATGNSKDCRETLAMWSFQGSLVAMHNRPYYVYLYHLNKSGNTLIMENPRFSIRTKGDTLLWEKDVKDLNKFGINSLSDTFSIVKLSSDEMVLETKSLRLHLEKY